MAPCIHFHLTGGCPRDDEECPYKHDVDDKAKWKVVVFPKFYTRVNTVRALKSSGGLSLCDGSTHPPLEVVAFFEIIYPMVRFYGPIKRMAVSMDKKKHLTGNFYVEYQELSDACIIEDDLVDITLLGCTGICHDLFPNLHLKTFEERGGQILESVGCSQSDGLNFLCGLIEVNRTPMTFMHGACKRENCDATKCMLLHLVTTTTEQLLEYEKSYQDHSDEEMLELEESLKKMDLEESIKMKVTTEKFEGMEEVLQWSWKYKDLV